MLHFSPKIRLDILMLIKKTQIKIFNCILNIFFQTFDYDRVDQDYTVLAQVLSQAETLSSISASSFPLLQAEINLELGKVRTTLSGV